MDFICSLTGFGLVFSIYKLIKRFKSKPLMNVDSIVEIGNNNNKTISKRTSKIKSSLTQEFIQCLSITMTTLI